MDPSSIKLEFSGILVFAQPRDGKGSDSDLCIERRGVSKLRYWI